MNLSRGAIVLCGGASSRMGRDKALLPFGPHEVLLQRVVRLVGEVVPQEQIVCVAAAKQLLPPLDSVEIVRDAARYQGPLAGLATGLASLGSRTDAVLLCGCDAPLLVPAFVERMFEFLAGHQIAVPYVGEQLHPLAAVYRSDLLPIAKTLLAAGERSLLSLADRCDTVRVAADQMRSVDPMLGSLANCNTELDYLQALRTSGFQA